MEGQFPKINVLAVLCSGLVMYVMVVRLKLGIPGYILGFSTRFLAELVWELVVLCRNYPTQADWLPSMAELRANIFSVGYFSLVFVMGFSSELIFFETVPIIMFQSEEPSRNIALWMSIYQIYDFCNQYSKV